LTTSQLTALRAVPVNSESVSACRAKKQTCQTVRRQAADATQCELKAAAPTTSATSTASSPRSWSQTVKVGPAFIASSSFPQSASPAWTIPPDSLHAWSTDDRPYRPDCLQNGAQSGGLPCHA